MIYSDYIDIHLEINYLFVDICRFVEYLKGFVSALIPVCRILAGVPVLEGGVLVVAELVDLYFEFISDDVTVEGRTLGLCVSPILNTDNCVRDQSERVG